MDSFSRGVERKAEQAEHNLRRADEVEQSSAAGENEHKEAQFTLAGTETQQEQTEGGSQPEQEVQQQGDYIAGEPPTEYPEQVIVQAQAGSHRQRGAGLGELQSYGALHATC